MLVKTQMARPHPQSFQSGWSLVGPRIGISNKFPGDENATGDTARGGSWAAIPGFKLGRGKSGSGEQTHESRSVKPDPW